MQTDGDTLRQRKVTDISEGLIKKQDSALENVDSDDDRIIDDKTMADIKTVIGQSSDEVSYLKNLLDYFPQRWKNYIVRSIFTFLMVFGFLYFIYMGPIALMLVTFFVQVKCFQEIISVGYAVYRVHGLPWFRSLSWYFLITSNYFFYIESLSNFFDVFLHRARFLNILIKYHRFISFSLYMVGILWFVLSLKKRYYMRQFSLFAWTHVTLLIVVTQSYMIIRNLFQGLIWFIVPVSMVVINDVMAYLFGFFFGRTPLIKISPKKTWEGFIGGAFTTIIFGAMLSHTLCKYQYFVCPVEYDESYSGYRMNCTPPPPFQMTQYELPAISHILGVLKLPPTISVYPFVLHSLALSTFSSIIAPFGGFFASGFKRAFKIKDFGDVIPGHGGIMDRFDSPSPNDLIKQIMQLKSDQQKFIFDHLNHYLADRNLL